MKLHNHISDAQYAEMCEVFENHSIYHTREWHQFLKETFGWRTKLISDHSDGKLSFFFPYIEKRSIGFRKKRISLPLSHHVPLLATNDYTVNWAELLHLTDGGLECKTGIHSSNDLIQQSIQNDLAVLDLAPYQSIEELFAAMHKSSIQRKIKKARKSGVEINEAASEADYQVFMDMEVETRMRQGSPIYPMSFFRNLYRVFHASGKVKLFIATVNEKPAAGIIFLHHNNTAIYAYGGSYSNDDWFKLGVNQLAMWAAIEDAFNSGCTKIDFGTSPRSQPSLLAYKLKWGAEKIELPTSYILPKGETPPIINREGKLSKMVSSAIQVMPKPLFTMLTPHLLKLAV